MDFTEAIRLFADLGFGIGALYVLYYVVTQQSGGDQRNDGLLQRMIDLAADAQKNNAALVEAIRNNTEVIKSIPGQLQGQQVDNLDQIRSVVETMSEVVGKEQTNVLNWTKTLQETLGLFTNKFNETINETKENRKLSKAANVAIVQELEQLKDAIERMLLLAERWALGDLDKEAVQSEVSDVIKNLPGVSGGKDSDEQI